MNYFISELAQILFSILAISAASSACEDKETTTILQCAAKNSESSGALNSKSNCLERTVTNAMDTAIKAEHDNKTEICSPSEQDEYEAMIDDAFNFIEADLRKQEEEEGPETESGNIRVAELEAAETGCGGIKSETASCHQLHTENPAHAQNESTANAIEETEL
ncbi:hypothetical protein ENBRE01_3092 [Enteropsectra breve]|nr:hypothetical protein ENBRE01_3092 [Enteropsectra breve]